jgi:hypothetical protein
MIVPAKVITADQEVPGESISEVVTSSLGDQWWKEPNVFSGGSQPYEYEDAITAIGFGLSPEDEDTIMLIRRQAGRIHSNNGKYVGSIGFYAIKPAEYLVRPEFAASRVIDVYGNPLRIPWETDENSYWQNTNNQIWQDYMLEQAIALVDIGADGVIIDEIDGTYGSLVHGGSFGEPDMSMFRTYLASIYTTQELLDLFGIEDIETFNYKDYIHNLGLADTWMSDPRQVPLFDDYERFQLSAVKDFANELLNQTRSYALSTYGRSIAFSANITTFRPSLVAFSEPLDYFTNEFDYEGMGYPPQSQAAWHYKMGRALGDKPVLSLPGVVTVADWTTYDPTDSLIKILVSEAYANQGAFLVPYEMYGWSEVVGPVDYTPDLSAIMPYYQFVRENSFLYDGLKSLANVVVIYSFPTDKIKLGGYMDSLRGATYALLDSQIQFDMAVMGDDVWFTDPFTSTSVTPYPVAFLPGAACLSDGQVDILLDHVSGGGVIVAWDDTGIHDESCQQVVRPELEALTVPGTHAYGNGWFVMLTGDPGTDYAQTHDLSIRQLLTTPVNDHANRITTATAPRTLNLLAYEKADGSQMVAHLVNYDYDISTDVVTPTGSFTMTMLPLENLDLAGDLQVYLMSPQRPEPTLVEFAVEGGHLVFHHSGVDIYDVLYVTPVDDARDLAEDVLDLLYKGISQADRNGYDTSSMSGILSQIDGAVSESNHLLARQYAKDGLDQLSQITRKRILFDETHSERGTLSWERALQIEPENPDYVYWGKLADALGDEFAFESNLDSPLTLGLLQGYDALMLAAPSWPTPFQPAEIDAIHQFVSAGGGLIVIGNCGTYELLNPITGDYAIAFDPYCVFSDNPVGRTSYLVEDLADHPATAGAPFLAVNWPTSISEVGDQASALATTDENVWRDANGNVEHDPGETEGPFIVAAAYATGQERVVAVTTSAFHDNAFEWFSNEFIMRSMLRWIAKWRPIYTDSIYLPLVIRE